MSARDHLGPLLDAYADQELHGVRRWQVRRHVARCAACRERLEHLASLKDWVRDAVATAPPPDLWRDIQLRLPPRVSSLSPSPRSARRAARRRRPAFALPVLGAVAAAATVAALTVGDLAPWSRLLGAAPQTVVRSLNTHGRPVMVLDGPDDATIIWLMDDDLGPGAEDSTSVWI